MDHFNKDTTADSPVPGEDEDDDDESHEQHRLVVTPDLGNGKGVPTIDGIYNNLSVDINPRKGCGIQCQNEYYSHFLNSKKSKESTAQDHFNRAWKKVMQKCTPKEWFFCLLPILSWLPKYKWRNDLAYDASAGFTVAVMNIPQGMAYALLSNVDPIVGLYMAFFPVILYSLMGTSRHVSIGTFAVICLMSGKVVTEKSAYYAEEQGWNYNESATNGTISISYNNYSPTEIATVLSFGVGIWQLILGFLRLGSLTVLLSDHLISGFTTGCAFHVLTSQMKYMFGLQLARHTGMFKIPLTYVDIMLNIMTKTNVTATLLSFTTIFILVTYNELIKPSISKRIPFPLPIELLIIIIGTLTSRYWLTSSSYGIQIVKTIPTGLPGAALPPMEVIPDVLVDSLIIAIVSYTISISMAKIIAVKNDYEVQPNQELLAHGSCNILGSFFSCAPVSVSLSRSLIQEQVGGKTQITGLFSCVIILFVLLWLAPFFETLPLCILASLIVVALKGMFLQVGDFRKYWKESHKNGAIWMISFLATVFLDIEYGLVVGLILTVSSLLLTSCTLRVTEIGQHVYSNLFLEKKSDVSVVEIPDVKILKLTGNMNFVNAEDAILKINAMLDKAQKHEDQTKSSVKQVTTLILDFSSVSSIDPAGIKAIRSLHESQAGQGVQILYVACPSNVLKVMEHCKLLDVVHIEQYFSSIEHAILSLESPLSDYTSNTDLHSAFTPTPEPDFKTQSFNV